VEDYGAFAHVRLRWYFALRRAGFSMEEIKSMGPQERLELGYLALSDERTRQ